MKVSEAPPGFIPQEHEIRLDGKAFLHHPLHVIDDAVEGAIGEPASTRKAIRDRCKRVNKELEGEKMGLRTKASSLCEGCQLSCG